MGISTKILILGLALVALASGESPARRLVVLITVDTLRADRLGAYGSPLGLTPHLDGLAARSELFTAAFAPAPFTMPSIAALMTGRYPQELGVVSNSSVFRPRMPALAEVLRDRGWHTTAVVSSYILRGKTGLARGFDAYDDRLPQTEGVRDFPERRAGHTTAAALRALDELPADRKPAFLWIHYQDPHGPYVPPEDRRALTYGHEAGQGDGSRLLPLSGTDSGVGGLPRYQQFERQREVAFYRAGYNGEVSHVDAAVGRLLEGLDGRGLTRKAIVLFMADHGESLGEHEYWFAHGERLHEELLRVPLLVRVPGRSPARRTEQVSLLDVFPTVTAFAGVPSPPSVRGADLLNGEPRRDGLLVSTFRETPEPRLGWITGGYQYETWRDQETRHERLSPLGAGPDTRTVPPIEGLRTALSQAVAGLPEKPGVQQTLSPEDRARLEALGYVAR